VPEKQKVRHSGQHEEMIAMTDSNDSEDSDASSGPRPPPTAVFTAPLEINVSKMFLPRAPSDNLPTHTVNEATAKCEAKLLAHLEELADNLSTSDHLAEIINAAGDGITTEERLAKKHSCVTDLEGGNSDGDAVCDDEVRPRQRSPTPDPEAWLPRKRTREEEAEFDAFFNKMPHPESTIPNDQLRVCKLGKGAMQIID
jgi:hypothetical protein